MFGLGPAELVIIAVIIMILFGAGKLPTVLSGLGKGLRDFKKAAIEPIEAEEEEEESPRDRL